MGLSNLPPGVTDRDCGVYDPDECPDCGAPIGDDVFCEACGAALDVEEARAEARWENADYLYDLHRDMERER